MGECPTCGSYDINRTEPRYYILGGKECTDHFHDEADGED